MEGYLTIILLGVTLSGATCALAAWLWPATRFDADGAPRGFPWAGLAFAVALAATTVVHAGEWVGQGRALAWALLALFAIGAISERLPVALGRPIRVLSLAFAALWVVVHGVRIEEVKLPFGPIVSLGFAGPALTVIWLFLVSLLVTLTNRGEALLPGIAVLSCLALAACAGIAGNAAVSVAHATGLGFATAGAALPVLSWCRPPSRVRFGMGGGMAVGLAVACVTVLGAVKYAAFLIVIVPALCLGAPLLAVGITVVLNRARTFDAVLLEGERVSFVGALVRRGMTAGQAVDFLLAWHLYLCLVAVLLTWGIRQSWALKLVILLVLGAGGLLAFGLTFQIVYGWRFRARAGLAEGISLLGIRVSRTSFADTLEHVRLWSKRGGLHHIVTADASLIERASREPDLAAVIDKAALVTPDGAGVLFSARVLGAPFAERVSGCDLVERICDLAAREKIPVYFLGAEPGVAEHAAARLEARYPGLPVAGVRHGYFGEAEEPEVVREVRDSGARVLFAALGVPRQEHFLDKHREELGVSVAMGIGGSLDVLSGRVRRAPEWMQRAGLEWLWRVGLDPKRLPRLMALPRFIFRVMMHTVRERRTGRG